MKLMFIAIVSIILIGKQPSNDLMIASENQLDFQIEQQAIMGNKIQMFHALLNKDGSQADCDLNAPLAFEQEALPLDIFNYYENRGEEEYYTLLTKNVYGLNQDISFFTSSKLSDESYLQSVMPHNVLTKTEESYELEVGFGAPDISYTLDFYTETELTCQQPELAKYVKANDNTNLKASLTVVQHNYHFGKVLGQKTSKMSVSVTRYFDAGQGQTMAINYTLNFIHNLPPTLLGGGNLLVKQIKEGVIALVRDTRSVCEAPKYAHQKRG